MERLLSCVGLCWQLGLESIEPLGMFARDQMAEAYCRCRLGQLQMAQYSSQEPRVIAAALEVPDHLEQARGKCLVRLLLV